MRSLIGMLIICAPVVVTLTWGTVRVVVPFIGWRRTLLVWGIVLSLVGCSLVGSYVIDPTSLQ